MTGRGAGWKQAGNIYVEFRDTGRGIAAEDLPFVFEKFKTGGGAGSRGGTGHAAVRS